MLPSGTVTFLFTDVQGSTARWESQPEQMRAALTDHNAILESVIGEHGGHIFKTVGDGYCAAFPSADQAAHAALAAQKRLGALQSPLAVRMGLHTATIHPTGNDYFGPPVNRVARITSAARGGQTLVSDVTAALLPAGVPRKDLGQHSLRDLLEPMRLWQLGEGEFEMPSTLSAVRHNLPVQTTSFIGREEELKELERLLDKSRLVTLTGTGGTGKSRLSLQFVAEHLDRFPDGVWFVELAALPERDDVLREIVSATGAPEGVGTLPDQITLFFSRRRSCLILDNCEHVLDIAGQTAERLIRSCPELTVIATSREPLGAAGEAVYRVPSLPTPNLSQPLSLQRLEEYGSSALFVERLATSAPNYGLTDEDAPTIAKICTRLDGIPLALELAAARGRAMRLDQVEKRLDDRFRLLTGGSRNALSRQQTLQALIDWSVQLLSEDEKRLFTSLAVFAGGWDIEAAEAVCGCQELGLERWQVLDVLTALVDKSLVLFDHATGRYKMLESIRQYATEQLSREPWAAAVRDRHSTYFLEYADPGSEFVMLLPPSVQERFNREYENIRSALEWSSLDADRAVHATGVARNLWAGFLFLARSGELARILEPLLEAAKDRMSDRDYLWSHTILAGAYARAGRDEGRKLMESLRGRLVEFEPVDRWRATTILAYTLFRAGMYRESIATIEPMIADFKDIVGPIESYAYVVLGLSRACSGDLDGSDGAFETAMEVHTERKDHRGWAACALNMAMTHALRGRWPETVRHALATNEISTNERVLLSSRGGVLSALGLAALHYGDPESGTVLCAAAYGRNDEQDPLDPLDQLFNQAVRNTLEERGRLEELQRACVAAQSHDWEPFFRALTGVTAEQIVSGDRFTCPFPDLLPTTRA